MPDYREAGARVSERWSPGRPAKVEVQSLHPKLTEDPMTEERMALVELLQKSGDGDFLRSVAEAVLQILMEADVEGLIGAGRHERTGDRLNYRNGYRERSLDTRLGSLQLRIPKLRQSLPRRRPGREARATRPSGSSAMNTSQFRAAFLDAPTRASRTAGHPRRALGRARRLTQPRAGATQRRPFAFARG